MPTDSQFQNMLFLSSAKHKNKLNKKLSTKRSHQTHFACLFEGQARLREYDSRHRNEMSLQNPKLLNYLLCDFGLSFNLQMPVWNRTTDTSSDFIKQL